MTSDPLPPGGLIRKLLPADHVAYREHLLRLDPQSRRSRFSGAVSDEFIRNYAALSRNLDTVIHGFFVDGELRGVAELRPLGDAFAQEAEAAFSIERSWQSHGVGAALLRRTLLSARNRRIRLLYMACLAENKVMQRLARKFDAELKFDFGSVAAHVEAPQPTAVSLMRESLADTLGFATAVLDVQARWLKPA
ncbi:MAG: GNAT family N-acetyltransferase [Variibacter sp.]